MPTSNFSDLNLVPLGAGDLIDRAVRLYRRHLFTLMRIAAPPVVISAIGWVMLTISFRELFNTSETGALIFYVLLLLAGFVVIIGGHVFGLIVMGGASRNLVAHLLWNEPVLVRTTYAAVRSRFWSLFGASLLIVIWLWMSSSASFFVGYMLAMVLILIVVFMAQVLPPYLTIIFGVILGSFGVGVGLWLFFFLAGKIAYVPQVMLVEGKRVFEAVGRSFSLAKGNVRRLMAMTFFITFATYSALMILLIPLGWIGYINGIDVWSASQWPAWYAISYSVLEPISSILLAPVWMLGMSLLYVDERVRHEGYDIELMAAQKLGAMPKLNVHSPLAPAISAAPNRLSLDPSPAGSNQAGSILGLNRV